MHVLSRETAGTLPSAGWPGARRAQASIAGGIWWLALVSAWLLLCAPLLLVDLPPLTDYPNHLARMVVLSRLGDDPFLSLYYAAAWGIIPDLAIDAFMPALLGVMPAPVAGKAVLAGILLLDVAGAAAYAAAIHGRRTWWSLGAALAAHNVAFMMGFLNFGLGTGLAMSLAAIWIRLRPAAPRLAAAGGAAAAALLFFCHLMGVFFFLVLVAAYEAWLARTRLRLAGWTGAGLRRAAAAAAPLAAAVVPAAALCWLGAPQAADGETMFLSAGEKLWQLTWPFANYDRTLDLGAFACVWGLLLACLATRRLVIAPGAAAAVAVVAALYAVLPISFGGTGFLDTRLSVMLGFLAFTAFRPRLDGRTGAAAGIVLAALLCVRVATLSVAWNEWRTDTADARSLAALVQPGERVVQIDIRPDEVDDYTDRAPLPWRLSTGYNTEYHLVGYFLIERSAFWPSLFVNPGQQPLRLRQPYEALANAAHAVPGHAELSKRRAEGNPPAPNPYCAFDALILTGTWAEPDPATLAPDWLDFVAANRTAALYRIKGARRCTASSQ
jgi:hypothetical protein